MTPDDLNNRFRYHPPTGNQAAAYEAIRFRARDLALWLNTVVPDGRELSLAITHLEDVVMWANAAIARDPSAHAEAAADGGLARYVKQ